MLCFNRDTDLWVSRPLLSLRWGSCCWRWHLHWPTVQVVLWSLLPPCAGGILGVALTCEIRQDYNLNFLKTISHSVSLSTWQVFIWCEFPLPISINLKLITRGNLKKKKTFLYNPKRSKLLKSIHWMRRLECWLWLV